MEHQAGEGDEIEIFDRCWQPFVCDLFTAKMLLPLIPGKFNTFNTFATFHNH